MIEFQIISNSVFFVTLPALAALYMLKLSRRSRKMPSVELIKGLISDNKGSSLFKKLTSNMLLFLEFLFLILLVCVLMNPGRPGVSVLAKNLVLLIDNSITMSSLDGGNGKTRLSEALRLAKKIMYSNSGSCVSVIEFSDAPGLLAASEFNRGEAALKIDSIKPSHLIADYKSAVALAEGIAADGEYPEIHIFSDFSSWRESKAAVSPKITAFYHAVGNASRNIGVSSLEVSEENEGGAVNFNIFFTVKNYCDYEVAIPASVYIDGKLVSAGVMSVAAGKEESKIIKKYGAMPSETVVELITSDILAADDKRVWSSSGKKFLKALVMGSSPYFYASALEASGKLICDKYEEKIPKSLYRSRQYDLVIIDDSAEAILLNKYFCRNFIIIQPPEGYFGLSYSGGDSGAAVRTPEFPFAYMRNIDLSDIYIHKVKRAVLNSNFSQTVYSAAAQPLFSIISAENFFAVNVFFNPAFSNFPLKVSFPVFFCNIVNMIKSKNAVCDSFFTGRDNYFNLARSNVLAKESIVRFSYDVNNSPAGFSDFEVSDITFDLSNVRSAARGALTHDVSTSPAGEISSGVLMAPRFTIAGRYNVFRVNGNSSNASPLFSFYVNAPPVRNLNVTPYFPEIFHREAAVKTAAGPSGFERTHISFAAPLILAALAVLLLDWIYQNYRTFLSRRPRS